MGTTMKLVANTLLGLGMQVLAEAIALGEKAGLEKGLEKGLLLDVLEQTAVLTPGQKAKLANVEREQYPNAVRPLPDPQGLASGPGRGRGGSGANADHSSG